MSTLLEMNQNKYEILLSILSDIMSFKSRGMITTEENTILSKRLFEFYNLSVAIDKNAFHIINDASIKFKSNSSYNNTKVESLIVSLKNFINRSMFYLPRDPSLFSTLLKKYINTTVNESQLSVPAIYNNNNNNNHRDMKKMKFGIKK